MNEKISDIGKAANQPISHETWEAALQEIEQYRQSLKRMEDARAFDMRLASKVLDIKDKIEQLQKENSRLRATTPDTEAAAHLQRWYEMRERHEAEVEHLHHALNEQAKAIDSLEHRLGNQAVTIKTQAATIARQEGEAKEKAKRLDEVLDKLKADALEQRRQMYRASL